MKATMIFNHFKNILDELIDESNFFKYYFQYPTSLDEDIYWEDWEECEAIYSNSTSIRFGASRGCLIDDTYDYVVKFDLTNGDEAPTCSDEVLIYDAAAQNGLERFFAKPIYLGTYTKKIKFYAWSYDIENPYCFDEDYIAKSIQELIDNYDTHKEEIEIKIPLYAYPKAERHEFHVYEEDQDETYRSVSHSNSPLVEREAGIGYAFISMYGEDVFDALTEFCDEHNINDLHTGNVMELNGELIFTDYCGYPEW